MILSSTAKLPAMVDSLSLMVCSGKRAVLLTLSFLIGKIGMAMAVDPFGNDCTMAAETCDRLT